MYCRAVITYHYDIDTSTRLYVPFSFTLRQNLKWLAALAADVDYVRITVLDPTPNRV